jgi:hypothetical protein
MGLSEKYSAAFGSRIKFFETPILLILRSKMNKIGVSKKSPLATNTAKGLVRQLLQNIIWRYKPPKVKLFFHTTP